jgi:hypothetical protein
MRNAAFVAAWTLATAVALVVADFILGFLRAGFPFLGGIAIGAPVAFAQWLVLRRVVAGSAVWMPATIIGFGFMWLIGMAFAGFTGPNAERVFASFAATTPIIGAAQSRVMRRWTRRSAWWIVVSAIAWTGWLAVLEIQPGSGSREMLFGGLVAGAVTGVTLLRFLSLTPSEPSE